MRGAVIFSLLIMILGAVPTHAGEMREIELNDGSIITGEILSLAKGVYTVKSASLGTIKLDETIIRAIHAKPPTPPVYGNNLSGSVNEDIRSVQEKMTERMMSDEEVMSKILSLQNLGIHLTQPTTTGSVWANDRRLSQNHFGS